MYAKPVAPDHLPSPHRLARLTVEMGDSIASVVTCNVACFSVEATQLPSQIRRLDIDGCTLSISDDGSANDSRLHYFQRDDSGRWRVGLFSSPSPPANLSLRY